MPSQLINPKRKAIADSNKTMFLWVTGMSVVVGMCVVVMIFLGQQIMFKMKVVSELTTTVNDINYNNDHADELLENIRVLSTNSALTNLKANGSESALQVPLDALPADRNTLALGASLQEVLLTGVDGLKIESIAIDSDSGATVEGDGADASTTTIPISIQLSAGSASTIKDALSRLERSIRIIDVDGFVLERSDTQYEATITAHAYYEPAQELKLQTKTIMPGGKK